MMHRVKGILSGLAYRIQSVWSGRLDWGGLSFFRPTVSGINVTP